MLSVNTVHPDSSKSSYFLKLLKTIHKSDAHFLGNYAKQYEYELAQYFGSLYAINIDSKIQSIINVLKGHNVGINDEVICTSFGMAKTVNAMLKEKIIPVFADLNPGEHTISFEHCKTLLNSKTKAIILSYPFGIPNQSHLFQAFAKEHNILLIEDIQSSIGSSWRDQKLGTFGDVAFFNHHPKNSLCCNSSGLCITDSTPIAQMLRSNIQQPYSVLHDLSEFLGAIGLYQFQKLELKLSELQKNYSIYSNYLSNIPGINLYQDSSQSVSSKHFIPLRVHPEERNFFYDHLKKHCSFIEKNFEAAHNNALINVMLRPPHLPNTEQALQETLVLNMNQEKTHKVIEHIALAEKIQNISEKFSLSA